MNRLFSTIFVFFISISANYAQKSLLPDGKCLTETETILAAMINAYRAEKNLPPVTLSVSLGKVARTHAIDQTNNHVYGSRCNLHSWSADGSWSSCCYTPDHRRASCMWNKPRELTNYPGDGYEISFYSTFTYDSPEAFARDILQGWKNSPHHNEVIVNKGIWRDTRWLAMGIGIYGYYANVWFGKTDDPAGAPSQCE